MRYSSHLTITHPCGTHTYYAIGPDQEFKDWKVESHMVTLRRSPRDRVHIPAGSILNMHLEVKAEEG